jgi:hypothetical protein
MFFLSKMSAANGPAQTIASPHTPSRDWRFWMVFVCVMLSQFLTALELSSVSTALPTIVNALHGDQFVWIGSGEINVQGYAIIVPS